MSIIIVVPTALRRFVDNCENIFVEAGRVDLALNEAIRLYPKLGAQLFGQNGKLRGFILVFVNSKNIRHLQQELTVVVPGDKITLVPALAGG
jgi:molybdopterin synthase sulfur carrier subunit